MNSERQHDDLIDLGAVTVETKGPAGGTDDVRIGKNLFAGLSEE